jgi:hypothetical protein
MQKSVQGKDLYLLSRRVTETAGILCRHVSRDGNVTRKPAA